MTCFGQTACAGTLTVVREIDFPDKLRLGLDIAWDGQYLNVPGLVAFSDGSFGSGFLQIDPSDGSLASEFGLGGLPIRSGITFDGTDYWTSIATSYSLVTSLGGDVVYAHVIEKWSGSDGSRLESFGFSFSSIQPHGLAWDGTNLWLADDLNGLISRLDGNDLSVVESFPAPGTTVRGLTWDGSAFWTVDAAEDQVYRFDSAGNVLGTYSIPAGDQEGITYDGEHLWVVDNSHQKLYQLVVPEPSTCVLLGLAAITLAAMATRRGRKQGAGSWGQAVNSE